MGKLTDAERVLLHSIPVPEAGCWLWLGSTHERGYGRANMDGKNRGAHRLSYRAFVGPIPEGADICHKCDTPACVNPDHLFAGTRSENMLDMFAKGRAVRKRVAECKHGHPATPENRVPSSNGGTACRPCKLAAVKEWHRRNRAKPRQENCA